ncbi:uncharacterized protein L969DRAFT_96364 [Mixia osmundae IAM 14324]|uniref:Uncharacterized protein n=1 Tax=Mixia osmundae (strain CBS 9802 / IAM 14324 / JCM 22182 / KY 12970) TaxID=764103 RepID=G7DWF0_MIXOS|nr:uncharacterized protein L969DRAFT_96364 [Mixia osmundae IAM 14324]KEI37277.1 hypothetical protein L969DRAFT_96364 [Mixia osmundae IAM 14324]GAA94910.1 hypothetical protein E5Q_01565 [Mixia osmundae IAM 14324]
MAQRCLSVLRRRQSRPMNARDTRPECLLRGSVQDLGQCDTACSSTRLPCRSCARSRPVLHLDLFQGIAKSWRLHLLTSVISHADRAAQTWHIVRAIRALQRLEAFHYEQLETYEPKSGSLVRDVQLASLSGLQTFVSAFKRFRQDVKSIPVFGFAFLALLYAANNHAAFAVFRQADPGTIQLVKGSGTLISALILTLFLLRPIPSPQWLILTLQACALTVTQTGNIHLHYSISLYLLLIAMTCLSSAAGVINDHLCKATEVSLHAQNVVLYSIGAATNVYFFLSRLAPAGSPTFWQGYGSFGAVMLILSNASIGLIITAVYKYGDAVLKGVATSVTMALMLLISAEFFDAPVTWTALFGAIGVLVATWAYVGAGNLAKAAAAAEPKVGTGAPASPPATRQRSGLALTVLIFIAVVMSLSDSNAVAHASGPSPARQALDFFNTTVAIVRYGIQHGPERAGYMDLYRPFFQSMHISYSDPPTGEITPEVDHIGWRSGAHLVSAGLASLLLRQNSSATGVLYFHFDAWIDPLRFTDMPLDKFWIPFSGNPRTGCYVIDSLRAPPRAYDWWGFRDERLEAPLPKALKEIAELPQAYVVDQEVLCVGFADIFYVPQRCFEDLIRLAAVFEKHHVFHEIALINLVRIIEATYAARNNESVISWLVQDDADAGGCWGDCCRPAPDAQPDIVRRFRCGHRLDFLRPDSVEAHYGPIRQMLQNESVVFINSDDKLVVPSDTYARLANDSTGTAGAQPAGSASIVSQSGRDSHQTALRSWQSRYHAPDNPSMIDLQFLLHCDLPPRLHNSLTPGVLASSKNGSACVNIHPLVWR